MNVGTKWLIALGILAVLAGAGAYAWSYVDNADRISDFGQAITHIGFARGGEPPDEAAFRTEIESLAAAHDVEIESMTITSSRGTGLDGTGRLANERLASVGSISMQLFNYDVVATVHAKKFLFSRTGNINVRRAYRMQVDLTPNAPGSAVPGMPTGLQPSVPLPEVDSAERGVL